MYNRDGSPRGSWYDPLGFSGLDKVPPPPLELPMIETRRQELQRRQAEIAAELTPQANMLQELGAQLQAMRGNPHLAFQYEGLEREAIKLSESVKALRRQQSENETLLASLTRRAAALRAGARDDPRAHIAHLGKPVSPAQMRFNRLAEFWAAISISGLLFGIVAILLLQPAYLPIGAVVLVVVFILLESVLRGTYVSTINSIAVMLAIVGAGVILIRFWIPFLIGGLIAAAVFLLLQKVGELRE